MSAEAAKRDAVLRFACKELAASEQPKGSSKRSKLPLTKRQKELNWNSGGAEIFLDWLESIGPNENERRRFAKLREDYDLVRFEKLRKSEKKRSAFAFLIFWGNAVAYDREAAQAGQGVKHATVRVPLRLGFLLPFVRALNENDAEFFDGLAEAMRIQNQRKISNKGKYLGSFGKWLVEYGLVNGRLESGRWTLLQTTREFNEQIVSKFWHISDDKLRRKCKRLGFFPRPAKRGPKTRERRFAALVVKKKS